MFRRRICTKPENGTSWIGPGPSEVVQVGPIQMLIGPKQNYSSKHLDRTSTGPGSEQLRHLNSILDPSISFELAQYLS